MSFPTNPTESYEGSEFGFGPFEESGGNVVIPPAHPYRAGYGGSAYDGGVFSGSAYGMRPYGDVDISQVSSQSQSPQSPFVNQGFGGTQYGQNPYGLYSQSVPLTGYSTQSLNTTNSGFGGDPFGNYIYGSGVLGGVPQVLVGGYGQSESGGDPYGNGSFPVSPFAVSGGYGGDPFGLGAYGSIEYETPYLSSAISLNGYEIEVFFSEEMRDTLNITDPTSYELISIVGGVSEIVSVRVGSRDIPSVESGDFTAGILSVIITHTGTMLGGTYKVRVVKPITDISGNSILIVEDIAGKQPNEVSLLTKGESPDYSISVVDGDTLLVDFEEPILTESEFANGVENNESYSFQSSISYPISISVVEAIHYAQPLYNNQKDKVELKVKGMTSLNYESIISDSLSFNYTGHHLPNESSSFTGVEVGSGTSSASSFLSLSKNSGNVYGWAFNDTSGKLTPITSTYRFDFTFNASNTVFTPNTGTIAQIKVSDGNTQINVSLQKVGAVDYLDIDGISVVQVDWSSAETTISILRNQKAQVYAFVVNDTPIATIPMANFVNAGQLVGLEFTLASAVEVLNFHIISVSLNASSTVYSNSWNFLHNQKKSFLGSSLLAKDSLLTDRGPLTKDWGDQTLATKQDVKVRVNGVEVEVSEVNPYIGKISFAIPIPLMPKGEMAVETDYYWFPTPQLEMGGLNTVGSVLNKFDLRRERNSTSLTVERGVADTSRFTMGLLLPFSKNRSPLYVGHRYLGFEEDYSASLNSPTSLLLNQNPNAISVNKFDRDFSQVVGTYEAESKPTDWNLYGTDNGGLELSEGTYNVRGALALYYKNEDFTFDSSVNLTARFDVLQYTLNGIFTGVGFGFHNNHNLFFVGAIVINNMEHIALLKDSHRLDLQSSWEIAFTVESEIKDKKEIRFTTSSLPNGLEPKDRFQIFEGTQSGTYTISEVIENKRFGYTTIITEEEFPQDPSVFGNSYFKASFEIKHSERNTYRLVCDHTSETAELFVSGDISGVCLSIQKVEKVEPVFFGLDCSVQGQVLWGSLDPNSTNSTSWSFFRYGITPNQNKEANFGHRVFTELSILPQSNPNSEWFLQDRMGVSTLGANDHLHTNSFDNAHYFVRIEPFLSKKADIDYALKLKSEYSTGLDTIAEIWDTNKSVDLAFLLYVEPHPNFSQNRELVTLPFTKVTSKDLPYATENGYSILNNALSFSTPILSKSGILFSDTGERRISFNFAVLSHTLNGNLADFGFEVYLKNYTLFIDFTSTGISLRGDLGSSSIIFNWADNQHHDYNLVFTNGSISISVDGFIYTTVSVNTISTQISSQSEYIKYSQNVSQTLFTYINFHLLPSSEVKKTLGVFLGGDRTSINSWELPRTDSSTNPNSSTDGVVIKEISWDTEYQDIRIHREVTWGVTVFLDNLGSPPYYDGDYATDTTIPSAGWINVEYAKLPRKKLNREFGFVKFGSSAISTQKWDWVRYRLFDHPFNDYRSPQGMVLNNFNLISSGETLQDITPEVVEIISLDKNHVHLGVTHTYSDFIYKVIVDGVILSENEWVFKEETQTITFSDNVLNKDHYPVTVVYRVNENPTTTYLKKQPLLDSVTLLNEQTPSFAKSRLLPSQPKIEVGSPLVEPLSTINNPTDGIVLNDPHSVSTFEKSAEDLYESLEFVEIDDDGDKNLISTFCDDPFAEHGLREIVLEGKLFYDKAHSKLPIPKFNQGGGFPKTFLFASGGDKRLGGLTNTPQTLTYPLANNGMQNRTFVVLRIKHSITTSTVNNNGDISTSSTSLTETLAKPITTNAPSKHSPHPLSPSVSTTNGGCFTTIEQAGEYGRLGPWGGISSLEASGNQQISIGGNSLGSPYSQSSLLNGSLILQGGSALPNKSEYSQIVEPA